MNVLLTHGYFMHEDEREAVVQKPYPPLGLLYLTAYLTQRDVEVEVYDTTFSSFDSLAARLLNDPPTYLGIYVNLMTKRNVLRILRLLRELPELARVRVILGGPEVTHHVDHWLHAGADAVVIGEGEETLYELLCAWDSGAAISGVDGIAYKDALGFHQRTSPRKLTKQLDMLPPPQRSAIDLQPYFECWRRAHGVAMTSVSTMRGCPYTCRWCSRAVYGQSYRRRSADKVVEELVQVASTYGIDHFWFVDDVFTISQRWIESFADAVRTRELKITYECITRADCMNESMAELLAESGCSKVWIGAESGSQRILA
jgi:anaerobic magnesium-protoporphyrin IX monomethyl ester cyclase